MSKNKQIGKWGEEFVATELVNNGYHVLEQNWQTKLGEIDLICLYKNDLVFVEVKTRSTDLHGWGEEAVTQVKKDKISKTINQFLLDNENYQEYYPRFDIIVVEIKTLTPKIIHYENVEL